jgi:hypothetical protein
MLGEYVGRAYSEVKRRALYVIEETRNLDPQASVTVAPRGARSAGGPPEAG